MPNRARQIRLGSQHQAWVYVCVAALLLTGALWLLFHFFVSVKSEFGDTHHPLEVWWLKLHGFAAMGGLILFGSLMPVHIRTAWHQKRHRWTGGALVVVMSALALSGYGLYYAGNEEIRTWISNLHWVVGLALLVFLTIHVLQRRQAVRRRAVRPAVGTPSAHEVPALHIVTRPK